jgi:3-methyladenine DNA glycosylase AlkD
MIEYCQEVTARLEDYRGQNSFSFDIYKTALRVLHINTAEQKRLFALGYSFSGLSLEKQSDIWHEIWQLCDTLEVRLQALRFFQGLDIEQLWAVRQQLFNMANSLENWCESDYLSALFAQLLERYPQRMAPIMDVWNSSDNFWLRRQSVVSLFYYQSLRKSYPSAKRTVQLVLPLINDPEHYVQKGLGWTLREALQVYPEQIYQLLDRYVTALSSTAFTTVMEKSEPQRKEKYKAIRKEARLKVSQANNSKNKNPVVGSEQ